MLPINVFQKVRFFGFGQETKHTLVGRRVSDTR